MYPPWWTGREVLGGSLLTETPLFYGCGDVCSCFFFFRASLVFLFFAFWVDRDGLLVWWGALRVIFGGPCRCGGVEGVLVCFRTISVCRYFFVYILLNIFSPVIAFLLAVIISTSTFKIIEGIILTSLTLLPEVAKIFWKPF